MFRSLYTELGQTHLAAYVGFEPTSLCSNTNALPIELIGSTSIAINHIELVLHSSQGPSLLLPYKI